MKFIKKRRDEYSYDDDASFYDEEYYGAPTAKEGNGFDDDEPAPEVKSTSGVSFAGSGSPVALKVVKPKGFEDAPEIADYLAEGSTVLLNIETLDTASTKRLLDFLLGAHHVTCNKDNKLCPNGGTGERQEAACTADDQTDRTDPNVLKKFVASVLAMICVDQRTDQRVVDGIPELNDHEQKRIPRAHTHDLRPEERHRSLERKAHVAAKVTRRVRDTVADTKRALAVGIQQLFLFHKKTFSFCRVDL